MAFLHSCFLPEFCPTKSFLLSLALRLCLPDLAARGAEVAARPGRREFCVNHTDGGEEPRPVPTNLYKLSDRGRRAFRLSRTRRAAEWQLPCLPVIQHLEETANAAGSNLRIISSCRGKIQQMELSWEKLLKVKAHCNLICICAFVKASVRLKGRRQEKMWAVF